MLEKMVSVFRLGSVSPSPLRSEVGFATSAFQVPSSATKLQKPKAFALGLAFCADEGT